MQSLCPSSRAVRTKRKRTARPGQGGAQRLTPNSGPPRRGGEGPPTTGARVLELRSDQRGGHVVGDHGPPASAHTRTLRGRSSADKGDVAITGVPVAGLPSITSLVSRSSSPTCRVWRVWPTSATARASRLSCSRPKSKHATRRRQAQGRGDHNPPSRSSRGRRRAQSSRPCLGAWVLTSQFRGIGPQWTPRERERSGP